MAGALPVVVIGHSLGGLVAQVLLSRHVLHAGVLVCPMPPGQVASRPALAGVRWLPEALSALIAGRSYAPSWGAYRALGLAKSEESTARTFHARVQPWPNRLCRELLRRPRVDDDKVRAPVLVAIGGADPMVPWQSARVLGDLYEAIVWRYDDLGHSPTHEPGGLRMARDIAAFCVEPRRPQVIESEGFGPGEGVGGSARRERRGENMKRRSAYGQRKAGDRS
jgi:pimeloyl-ACP methyl ester carboxylesterase